MSDSSAGFRRNTHTAQVDSALAAIRARWPAEALPLDELISTFPLGEDALRHLLAASSVCCARLIQEPKILLWLAHPDVAADRRGYGRMLTDLRNLADRQSIAESNFRLLRFWKGREMVRIALRETADAAPLEETMIELSQLADICLTAVFEHWDRELRQRWGSPETQFTVLGLGKLGGRELNHSSDIDLIFLYGDEGQLAPNLSYHEWFTRLGNKIVQTFASSDPAGSLFRIDLRLRPEGSSGPLVRSLQSMENYYAGFGETWERLALIKARWICGGRELAYDFLRELQPFIFPRNPTPDLLEEIGAIKHRIERDVVRFEDRERNLKLGAGGIREIEFVVQALQLLHAARHPFLQEPSTLKALHGLADLEFLPNKDAAQLETAYRFFRRVEHRLQIEAEQQTHTLPETGERLDLLACSLGFEPGDALTNEVQKQKTTVRAIFDRLIRSPGPTEVHSGNRLAFFRDRAQAERALDQLSRSASGFHVAPRTRQIFGKLQPLLLDWLRQAADPDTTLTQFIRFVESYGLRSLLFELLAANPRLLELLIKALDASEHAATLLVRRPGWLEELTQSGLLDLARGVSEHLTRLQSTGASADQLDPVRTYRQREWLRILLRDILQLAPLPQLVREQTDLAEACLVYTNQLINSAATLTVIGLGKFGGQGIGYGADLDVLFVGEDLRAAQRLMVAMAQTTGEGSLATIDARLRPDGEKGPLVTFLESLRSYYAARAQFWEVQALTRARAITGPAQAEAIGLLQEFWCKAGEREDAISQILAMLERIERERSSGDALLDLKTGAGGIIEAEFLVQALQMRNRIWEPNLFAALDKVEENGALSRDDGALLRKSYTFLRSCESVLRRWQNRSVSVLPLAHDEQQKLAIRMQFAGREEFEIAYRAAREQIREIASRNFRALA